MSSDRRHHAHPRGLPEIDARELAAIFAGGVVGTLARAGLAEVLPHATGAWPWATFAVNLTGAFVLGFAIAQMHERPPRSRYRRPFLATGLCGALTTFSTLQLELLRMLDGGHDALALAYVAASVAGGFGAVSLAIRLARRTGVVR